MKWLKYIMVLFPICAFGATPVTRTINVNTNVALYGYSTNLFLSNSVALNAVVVHPTNDLATRLEMTNYVASATNGLATTNYVHGQGFVTSSITNGLATTNYVDIATNGFLRATGSPDGTKFLRDDASWQAVSASLPDPVANLNVSNNINTKSLVITNVAASRVLVTDAAQNVTNSTVSTTKLSYLTGVEGVGILEHYMLLADAGDIAQNDYAKFTADGLIGRSYSEVLSDIGASSLTNGLATTAYVDTATNGFLRATGAPSGTKFLRDDASWQAVTASIPDPMANVNVTNLVNTKSLSVSNLTASRVLVSDGAAPPNVTNSAISTTTLGYLDVTSSAQTQINTKLATTSYFGWTGFAITTGDIATSNIVAGVNVTGLTFTPEANKVYMVRGVLIATSGATTTGVQYGFTGPGSPTYVSYGTMLIPPGAGTTHGDSVVDFSSWAAATTGPGTAKAPIILEGIISNGANSSAVQLMVRSEVANSWVTNFTGSVLMWQKLN
jgi:hypothetical protein